MDKQNNLIDHLKKLEKLCIAFSGGIDSTFLLHAAQSVLKENVMAIIARGNMMTARDFADAIRILDGMGIAYSIIDIDVFTVPEFVANQKDRCYYCKTNVFTAIKDKAAQLGFSLVADGRNADDSGAYRPGTTAALELNVISPLFDLQFSKSDIRQCARQMGIDIWAKPSNSCLATRIPYDHTVTPELLATVEAAEELFHENDVDNVRVRIHNDLARIELSPDYHDMLLHNEDMIKKIKALGFKYVTLDLEGFRSGSMD